MAVLSLTVLAAAATLEWPGWSYAWLVLVAGIFSLAPRGDGDHGEGRREAEAAAARRAEDAARIRELQDTVEELTRLRAAALEASQRRDEFLATISHELRSPLNVILGWTQVLEPRPELPADVRDALGVIRRNALRQRQLLDDLVDMSRVVSGALRIEPRPMRVQDALDEACQAVGPDMERKGIRLDRGPGIDAVVAGDASRLRHVLRTLLANAIGVTPAGGAISLRTAVVGPEVSIAITDTGAGIHADFLPQVFEPFRRQPGAAPRDASLLGLDLALARIIVVGHGGRILAHSDGPGRGSTFTVLLPAAGIQTTAAGTAAELSEVASGGQLAGLRVLAVDDEPDWRELLGHILGAAGADARIAASAAEALQIFEGWRPDVVLTDIAMPITDGYGLLGAIRGRGGAGRAVPAIAMTAHAGARERSRTAAAGFAEHLAKPIPPHELVDAVRRVAEQSSRARGAGAV